MLAKGSLCRGSARVKVLHVPGCTRRRVPRWKQVHVARAADKEQPPGQGSFEELFAEELRRRGLSSTDSADIDGDAPAKGPTPKPKDPFSTSAASSPFSAQKNTTTTAPKKPPPPPRMVDDQRARSIALVNEGLEGLIPRASQLVQLGGSVFLAFAPFILVLGLVFGGIYSVFGNSFVHGGRTGAGVPKYVDPQELLSEPTVDPYIPFTDIMQ